MISFRFIWKNLSLLVLCNLLIYELGHADKPIFGFDSDTCDNLVPKYLGDASPPTTTTKATTTANEMNKTSEVAEDVTTVPSPIPQIQLSDEELFKVTLNDSFYRRNRVIRIDISAAMSDMMIEGYAVEMRTVEPEDQETKRFGQFLKSQHQQDRIDQCRDATESDVVFTTKTFNSALLQRRNFTSLYWTAPDGDGKKLMAHATVITNDGKYWMGPSENAMEFKEFPPSRSKCGLSKSCVRVGKAAKTCTPDDCDYFLTWKMDQEDSEIQNVNFVMGGKVEADQYLGLGIITNSSIPYPQQMSLLTCRHGSEDVKAYYVRNHESGLEDMQLDFQNKLVEPDGKDRIWCKFTRTYPSSAPDAGSEVTLDLGGNLTLIFVVGKINDTTPLIPKKLSFGGGVGAWSSMQPISMESTVDIPLLSTGSSLQLPTTALLLHVIAFCVVKCYDI